MEPKDRLYVALDTPDLKVALSLAKRLTPHVGGFKIGSILYTAKGPQVVHGVQDLGTPVFLDLKFYDTPDTVRGAVAEATRLDVHMLTVHCRGGIAMMRAAMEGVCAQTVDQNRRPLVLGVTVLTSDDYGFDGSQENLAKVLQVEMMRVVLAGATMAQEAGLDGVVVPSQAIVAARKRLRSRFVIVTPGIRPAGANTNDQIWTAEPGEAIVAGADYIVVGRPIANADDPIGAAKGIVEEIAAAMERRICHEGENASPAAYSPEIFSGSRSPH